MRALVVLAAVTLAGLALAAGAGDTSGPERGFYVWAAGLLGVAVLGVIGVTYNKADTACSSARELKARLDALEPLVLEVRNDVKALLRRRRK